MYIVYYIITHWSNVIFSWKNLQFFLLDILINYPTTEVEIRKEKFRGALFFGTKMRAPTTNPM